MYARGIGDQMLTFQFNPNLHQGNLILEDAETGSHWSQLAGEAIAGPLEGQPLRVVPSIHTTWKHWKTLYPQTTVADPHRSVGASMEGPREVGSPGSNPGRRAGLEMVLGIRHGGEPRAYPFGELAREEQPLHDTLGDRQVVIHFSGEGPSAWATNGEGDLLESVAATQRSWLAFYPHSEVYSAGAKE